MRKQRTRVLMLCTGVGREVRGIETFFADAFAGLRDVAGLDITLGIGFGSMGPGQERVPSLSRMGWPAKTLGRIVGRDGYTIEQMTSIPSVLLKIRRQKPDVVFSSEANLAMRLMRLRHLTGATYRLAYSNGAPMRGPFPWADFVHQVTPIYRERAIADGDDEFRHILVPYGFNIPPTPPQRSIERRRAAKRALGLPEERPVILSVGWIAREHKRMDYVVDEIAKLPEPRPLLAMIGAMDEGSDAIITEAQEKLGCDGIAARSVPPDQVPAWYAAADAFVLGSLAEGFGRVYIEALAAGVPVFCHDYPVAHFVNGPEAFYGDFSARGSLTSLLVRHAHTLGEDPKADSARWRYAHDNFGWTALAPKYRAMFRAIASGAHRARPATGGKAKWT